MHYYHPMPDIPVIIAGVFLLGIARGASTCALICAPGMMPYIIVRKLSYLESLKLGILFNIPRILMLTALGAVVGYLISVAGHGLDLKGFSTPFGIAGYVLMGAILIAGGAYLLSRIQAQDACGRDPKRDTADENGNEGSNRRKKKNPARAWGNPVSAAIRKKMADTVENGPALFFILGGMLSIACLGELALIEGTVVTGVAAGTLGGAAPVVIGALVMFMFALGASVPVILVAVIGSGISGMTRVRKVIGKIRDIAAILLILVGLVLVFAELRAIYLIYWG
jgi:hypothetical protein